MNNEIEKLDSLEKLRQVDPSDFLSMIASLPEELRKAQEICQATKLTLPKKVRAVYILGMGGSGISALLVKSILEDQLDLPVIFLRSYVAPASLTKEDLLVAVSYSGNTGETLGVVTQAAKKKVPMVFITSGGKLAQIAATKKISIFALPSGYQPRAALGFLLVPLLYIFVSLGKAQNIEENLKGAATLLDKMKKEVTAEVPTRQNEAKKLATKIYSTFPLVFGSPYTFPVAYRFKTQLNENAKVLSHANELTEANHNEIEGLFDLKRGQHNFSVTLLRCDKDEEKVKKQMEITKSLIGAQVGGINEVTSRGKSKLARVLSLVYYLDMVSAYVAILREVDPAEIRAIQKLKKELSR